MRKMMMFVISLTIIAMFIFPTGCKKAEEPSKAPAPAVAPAPAPEQKRPEAPAPAPEKKSEETAAPQKKTSEASVTKQKAVKPSSAEAPAAAPEKKAPEPAPAAQKEIITEDSIYLAQSTTVESDGLGCVADDQSKATMAAMEDGKRNAIQMVMNGIKEKTKSPELKRDLLSAYSNSTIGNAMMLMRSCYKDDAKGQCCRTKLKVEVVPDPGKIKSLMK
jgi:hypothetical protein